MTPESLYYSPAFPCCRRLLSAPAQAAAPAALFTGEDAQQVARDSGSSFALFCALKRRRIRRDFSCLAASSVREFLSILGFAFRTRSRLSCFNFFEDLARAYDVLGDPKKRQIYDTYGEDALKEGTGGGTRDPFDIFSSFFGRNPFGGGSGSGAQMKIRGRDVVHTLKVSLEMLYGGTTKKLSVSRNVICSGCDGIGSLPGDSIRCVQCKGSGFFVVLRAYGFERMELIKHTCKECEGTGECVYKRLGALVSG